MTYQTKKCALNSAVGFKIMIIRVLKGYSQQYLADKIRVDPRNIEKYEAGKVDLEIHTLAKIAKVLNIDISFFIDDLTAINRKNLVKMLMISSEENGHEKADYYKASMTPTICPAPIKSPKTPNASSLA